MPLDDAARAPQPTSSTTDVDDAKRTQIPAQNGQKRPRSDASGAAVENPQTVTGIGFSEVCGGAASPFTTNGRLPHEHLISASGWSRIASARCVARDTLGTCRRPPKKFEKNPKKFPKIAPTDRIFEKSCRLGTGLGSWVRVSTTDHFAPTTLILVAY